MTNKVTFTSPIGRMVGGDVYKGNTTDIDGNQLVYKSGANAGQPKTNFYIGLAVPKTPNVPWEQEPWGQAIMQVARTGVPNAFDQNGNLFQGRSFAFKITDGDSQIPNQKNKRPCDQEGYQGNWILNFSNGFAPKVCNADGSAYITEPDAVKRGYFIQVLCNVGANNDSRNPGVFLNHELVALAAYGEEIHSGVDASQAGFGGQPLPPGASTTPIGGMNQQQSAMNQGQPTMNQGQPTMNQGQPTMNQGQPTMNQGQPAQQGYQQPPPPANDLVNQQGQPAQQGYQQQSAMEPSYIYQGQTYTESALLAMPGWTPQHLAGLQKVS